MLVECSFKNFLKEAILKKKEELIFKKKNASEITKEFIDDIL